MKRFTILSLMGLVLALAVGLAALRQANDAWVGGLLMTVILLLCTSVVGVVYKTGQARAGWLGFLVFGGPYLALAIGPGFTESVGVYLPTTHWLYEIHSRVVATNAANGTGQSATVRTTSGQRFDSAFDHELSGRFSPSVRLGRTRANSNAPIPEEPNRWKTIFPGAENYDAFQRVGHALFTLIFGLIGATIARRFERGRSLERQAVSA